MTDLLSRRLVCSPQAVESRVGEETVILHLGNDTYFGLDALGTRIWELLKAGTPLPAIRDRLAEDHGVEAARVEAEVTGKPAAAFFSTALAHLGTSAAHTLMVGDDIESDVLAAQRCGITGVLVKTGKYLPETHRAAAGTPDHVLESFAELPDALGRFARNI